jgi:hypothetical protein
VTLCKLGVATNTPEAIVHQRASKEQSSLTDSALANSPEYPEEQGFSCRLFVLIVAASFLRQHHLDDCKAQSESKFKPLSTQLIAAFGRFVASGFDGWGTAPKVHFIASSE